MKEKPIRVLHILQRMEMAGVQALLMNIYRNIDRRKVQFDFLVHYKTPQFFDEEIERMGGKIYRLSVREDYNFIKYFKDLDAFFKEHHDYKIVHGHMHTLGFIYLHYAKKYNIPIRIAHSHTNNTQKDFKLPLKIIMNKLYEKNATELFACSKAAGEYMFKNKNFTVINNAIDSKKFAFDANKRKQKRRELNISNNFVVGCVGRFEIQKNQKFSVNVFSELIKEKENAVLLFIGSGSMEPEIKQMVSNKNLEKNILFLGNRDDMPELYQAMDVFLFPSLFEGLGIVAVEAQASGTPVLCTDTLPDEINVTPLVHRLSLSNGYKAWAKELIKISNNKNERKNMIEELTKNNYEIVGLAHFLQEYYLKKSDNSFRRV